MRRALAIAWVLPALLGCNALTGVNDLESVDCVDCVDASTDTSRPDTSGRDTATGETAPLDVSVDTRPFCRTETDCDDDNACTSNVCEPLTGDCRNDKIDGDGDGESPTAGACGLDCDDSNKDVFSTQTMFFATPYASSAGSLPSFDYNCDGRNEQESTMIVRCQNVDSECTLINPGWVSAAPACGATGKHAVACRRVLTSGCVPIQLDKVQRCR
jgi:hypothetical protein